MDHYFHVVVLDDYDDGLLREVVHLLLATDYAIDKLNPC
jgi:hypothetical protein